MVSNEFKQECKADAQNLKYATINIKGTTTNITESDDLQEFEINSSCYVNDKFIGTTVAKKATVKLLDDGNYSLENKDITIKTGIEINNAKEYQKLGTYTIPKPDTEEVSGNTSFTGYDYMKKFDTPYVDSNTYPIRLDACLENLCSQVGLTLGNKNFPNNSYMIKGNPFTNGETRKTVLSHLVQLTGGFAEIDIEDGKVYVRNFDINGEAVETIDGNNYDKFKPNNVFGPVNSVRIQMNSGVDGEETIKEAEGVTDENRCQITIADNYYLTSAEEREAVINGIFNALNGLTYLPIKLNYYGYPWLKLGDKIKVKDKSDKEYVTYVMEHTLKYNGAYSGTIKAIALTKTQQAYKEVLSLKDWRRNTELAVDKINGKITQLTEETTENTQKLTKVEQNVNGITSKVSSVETQVENITNTQGEAEGKNIHIEDSSDEPLVSIKAKGETTQATRSGKNLAILGVTSGTIGEVPFIVDKGTININGTTISKDANYFFNSFRVRNSGVATFWIELTGYTDKLSNQAAFVLQESSDNSTWSTTKGISCESTTTKQSQVTLDNSKYYRIRFYTRENTFTNATIKIQLEYGKNKTGFEEAGTSPSPDYPSEIENLEGKNICPSLNTTRTINGVTFTKNKDGSITMNGTATAEAIYPINVNTTTNTKTVLLKANSKYRMLSSYESGKYITQVFYLKNNTTTYTNSLIETVEETKAGMYIRVYKDAVLDNVTIYPQITKGEEYKSYVPYNSLEIKDIGENKFNVQDTNNVTEGITVDNEGWITVTGDNTDGTATKYFNYYTNNLNLKTGTNFNVIAEVKNVSGTGNASFVSVNSLSQQFKTNFYRNFSVLANNTIYNSINETSDEFLGNTGLRTFISFSAGQSGSITFRLSLLEDTTITPENFDYEPYKSQVATFPLGEEKLMEGSYLADDGIHHKRKQIVFDGDEVWSKDLNLDNSTDYFYIRNIGINTNNIDSVICDYFKKGSSNVQGFWATTVFCITINKTATGIVSSDTKDQRVAKWKSWLSNNPITVEYELENEEIIPYTEDQKEAWDKIEQLHTYKNVTNIFSDAELDIVYVRDNGLSDMYETKQNANKNYTKTIQKFAEQKITTDEISSKVSSLETTTVKEIQVQYALGDNSVTAPKTGWSTTAPEWQEGKYMWQKTVTVYANETTVESSTTCIQGAKGEDGKKGDTGATGTGIKSIQEQYYLSTSNTTQTGGSWKNTQDIWTVGKYIWTRSHITWSDNTTTDTTPVLAQGLNTANETANDTKENLENNYSTTVEMNSAITAKADEIITEVNKKVNETELGTKIEQNYEHVKLAWNQISEFIQMMIYKNKACLAILDEQGNVMTTFNQKGEHFYDSSGNEIGTIGLIEGENSKQIAFAINGVDGTNQMAWGVNYNNNFIPVFYFEGHNTESGTEVGGTFLLEAPLIMQEKMLFLGQGMNSSYIQGQETDNRKKTTIGNTDDFYIYNSAGNLIFVLNSSYLKLYEQLEMYADPMATGGYDFNFMDNTLLGIDRISASGEISGNNGTFNDIPNSDNVRRFNNTGTDYLIAVLKSSVGGGSIYCQNANSDKKFKKNIKDTEIKALDIIKQIQHRQFDWKENGKHEKIGFIAQELEKINPCLINVIKENDEKTYLLNEKAILATVTKAIQEQQKEIEDLKKEIEKLKENKIEEV